MSRRASLFVLGFATLTLLLLMPDARAQKTATVRVPVADVLAGAARLDFVPRVSAEGFVLSVSGPDGSVERHEFDSGRAIVFGVTGPDGKARPDGIYNFELRSSRGPARAIASTLSGQESSDGRAIEAEAAARARANSSGGTVQSGTFRIYEGTIIAAGALEPQGTREPGASSTPPAGSSRNASGRTALTAVLAGDQSIQGSLCVGLDCTASESFGFDSLRIKENNDRIKFEDTSVSVGFPTHDWQLTANDSASGGAEKFSIEDITAVTVPFTITGSAPSNSIFVDSTGRVGFRTATPVVDLHTSTSNTPALRLEQTSAGGFTAQTWDVAGNEANFFVRDVTGGSRLPFRIRPGAPTSSIDIAADGTVSIGSGNILTVATNGNVGIGMPSPAGALDLNTSDIQMNYYFGQGGIRRWRWVVNTGDPNLYMWDQTAAAYRLALLSGSGFLGIGVTNPTNPLQMGSGAYVSAGGVWTNASSREYKLNVRDLSFEAAEETLTELNPVTYAYKTAPDERHVGFIAEDVPDLVATPDRKGLSSMDIVGVLTKVVQEQQKTIKELSERLARVEAAGR